MRILRDYLVLLTASLLIVALPALAAGYTSAGLSLAAANVWTAAQTFPVDGIKIADASGDLLTFSAGTQTTARKLTCPALGGDTSPVVCNSSASQTLTTATYFAQNSLFLYNGGANVQVNVRPPSAGGTSWTAIFPSAPISSTQVIHVGFTGTTAAMSSGTVTVSDSRIKTGDLIHATRVSGASTSSGIHDYTIVDGTSFTLNANDATDNGVWAYLIVKP